MKKSRKISVFVTLALSLIFLACETPSSSSNNSGGSTPTNPDNPNGGGTTNSPAPIYEWIVTKQEYTQEAHQNNYDLEYSSISNYSYPTYNSKSDHSCISMGTTNQNQTLNGNNTQTETQSKTIYTNSSTK